MKSIESTPFSNAGDTYRDTYGRTVRFKTQESHRLTKDSSRQLNDKNKLLLETLELPKEESIKTSITRAR